MPTVWRQLPAREEPAAAHRLLCRDNRPSLEVEPSSEIARTVIAAYKAARLEREARRLERALARRGAIARVKIDGAGRAALVDLEEPTEAS